MPLTNNRYCYLAGKIKLGHGATGYRSVVAPILRKFGIHSLDPLRGKYGMESWESLSDNEVVVRDLQDIERAHVVLAVMLKCKDSSFGTPCEIMYAWERRIPVIMITDEVYLANHFWTKSLCSNIFLVDEANGDTFDEVLKKVARHIGHWYGFKVEQEVYDNPVLAQESSYQPSFSCVGCNCGGECDCPHASTTTPPIPTSKCPAGSHCSDDQCTGKCDPPIDDNDGRNTSTTAPHPSVDSEAFDGRNSDETRRMIDGDRPNMASGDGLS